MLNRSDDGGKQTREQYGGEKETEGKKRKEEKKGFGEKNDCPLRVSLYEALHVQEVPITSTSAGEERVGRVVCGLKYR